MPIHVKKDERETTQSLIRRFSRAMQESGILIRARKTRFRGKVKNELARKKSALRRIILKKEYEKLRKLGKLESKSWRR